MNNKTWVEQFYDLNPDAAPVEEVKKEKKNSLSLTVELPAMDFGDKKFYSKLTEEQKKEISLWVLMRFMSSSQNLPEHHLTMVNALVNNKFSSISKHPELQWMLLALCGSGRKQYHPWIAPPKGVKKNKLEELILSHFPLLNDEELELLIKINNKEEISEFLKENGYDDKTIKELLKSDSKGK